MSGRNPPSYCTLTLIAMQGHQQKGRQNNTRYIISCTRYTGDVFTRGKARGRLLLEYAAAFRRKWAQKWTKHTRVFCGQNMAYSLSPSVQLLLSVQPLLFMRGNETKMKVYQKGHNARSTVKKLFFSERG